MRRKLVLTQVRRNASPRKVVNVKEKEVVATNTDNEAVVIFAFALDDVRIAKEDRELLFARLCSLCADNKPMLDHLKSVLAYLKIAELKRRVWREKTKRPTHIVVAYDDRSPKMQCSAKKSPFDLLRDASIINNISCFMLYNVTGMSVQILNWTHKKRDDGDENYYLLHLCEAISCLKKRYLSPGLETGYIVVEIEPIYETLLFFGVFGHFVLIDLQEKELYDIASNAFIERDHAAMRFITEDPRFLTTNDEGIKVLRLRYRANICICVAKVLTREVIKEVCRYQCPDCRAVYFCTNGCATWSKCCKCSS